MRVLQISKFYPPVSGGMESTVRALTEGLNAAGMPTDVLCAHTAAHSLHSRLPGGYSVTRAASFGAVLSTSAAPSLIGHTRRLLGSYDLLHVHMPDPMAALALWCARAQLMRSAASAQVPTVLVVHWHSDVVRQRLALKFYEPLQNWLLARADAVIATSEAYAEASPALQRWRDKVQVIPIGIGDNRGEVDAAGVQFIRQQYHGKALVFALGRMTYYKGFDVLIKAAASLPADCAVLIGGEGALLGELRHQVSACGLAGRVHLLGRIDEDQLANHFNACDVFCLPSTERSEAFGVAQLEAMCMGRPVVSAEVPGSGVTWINQHGITGLTVPVRDAQSLASALGTLVLDPALRRRMGDAGRARFDAEFTAEHMTRRTLALYRRLGAGAAPGQSAGPLQSAAASG